MRVIAIGGGEKTPAVTHALELSGEQRPHVLLVPSASSTEKAFSRKSALLTSYFDELGVSNSLLHEFGEDPSSEKIAHELGRSALIYTIGGNTPHMIKTMRRHGTDTAIHDAMQHGKIHVGTSAGALLPFELAHSNVSARPTKEEWDYEYLPTLGVVEGVASAHADQHDETPHGMRTDSRHDALLRTFPNSVNYGYAIDNGATLIINGSDRYVLRANDAADVHAIKREDDGTVSSTPFK